MECFGIKVVELYNILKVFGERNLFEKFEYNFLLSEWLGIIGKNGIGKFIFLNIIMGSL